MKTLSTVEDYIEYMAGYRDIDGKTIGIFNTGYGEHPISLARYDVGFVTNVAMNTQTPLTDRQAELAVKIILKYRRQFANLGLDISAAENRTFRNKLRHVDRAQRVSVVDGNSIEMRFPYSTQLIENVREFVKTSQGNVEFNREKRVWEVALTESNVNWVVAFAKANGFDIDPELSNIMDRIIAVESEIDRHVIRLQFTDGLLVLQNAPESMLDFIHDNIGAIEPENLIPLVDSATTLCYAVDEAILDALSKEFSDVQMNLIKNSSIRYSPDKMNFDMAKQIVEYAELTKRWPICIFQPDLTDTFKQHFSVFFSPDEIATSMDRVNADTKLVVMRKAEYSGDSRVPLLVTSAGMLFGGIKTRLLQNSEKIVYFATAVYTKKNGKLHEE